MKPPNPQTDRRERSASGRELATPYPTLRRLVFFGLVLLTSMLGTAMMVDIVGFGGLTVLEIVILFLFVPTFSWIAIAFWNAVVGFMLSLLGRDPVSLERVRSAERRADPVEISTRTALVMPAHNEDPGRVVGGLATMVASLERLGRAQHFDVHLLSDTTDPDIAAREEVAWLDFQAQVQDPGRLHYRRRPDNVGRKAGNIWEFCTSWGGEYDFMVVLDADSLMSGETLVELVGVMQANPSVGLVQTVPLPARQETLFGRLIQFAAGLYSPMLGTGQSFWQLDAANYWGHNAILRVGPFVEHCRLPVLSGSPPFGGAVLSHDFVEAALMRRAGWKVFMLPGLGGSYEEVPANILDFAKRDRRWAQGSLQHLRLLGLKGLHPLSRIHFALGAMGYISSALWLLILLASTLYVLVPSLGLGVVVEPKGLRETVGWVGTLTRWTPLLAVTAVVLFLPKVLGVVLAVARGRGAFGGNSALLMGALGELVFAVVLAPVMMMFHAGFVLEILAGRDIEWGVQAREGRSIGWGEAWRVAWGIFAIGVVWAGVTLVFSPPFLAWLSPILFGLIVVLPLTRWTSEGAPGVWLRARGLLRVPSEALGSRNGRDQGTSRMIPGPLASTEFPSAPSLASRRSRSTEASGGVGAQRQPGERKETLTMHEAERGLFELRRGRPLLVVAGDGSGDSVLVAAVEGLDPSVLDRVRSFGTGELQLVVTSYRAVSMGLPPGRARDIGAGVSLSLNGETPEQVYRLSSRPDSGVLGGLEHREATALEGAALTLARLGRLLPAVVSVRVDLDSSDELREALESRRTLSVCTDQIRAFADSEQTRIEVTFVSDAPVPLEESEDVRFMLFREGNGLAEHVAIVVGDPEAWDDVVPVRLHSACLTGDLFGSLRCDCGEQLRSSLRAFASGSGGVLLYLEQEGRGIGLGNKLRAYTLQQEGLDTVDADCALGFGADERRYHAAVAMLHHLGIERVRLLTNNPEKVRALEEGGIEVRARQPLHGTLNRHNLPYVRAKVQRAGHWLGDMLYGTNPGS